MSVSLFVSGASFPSRIGSPSVFARSILLAILVFMPVSPAFATDGVLRLQDAVEQAVKRAPVLLARDASRARWRRRCSHKPMRKPSLPSST